MKRSDLGFSITRHGIGARHWTYPEFNDAPMQSIFANVTFRDALKEIEDACHKTTIDMAQKAGIAEGNKCCAVCLRNDRVDSNIVLRRCTGCMMTYYCSTTCQRDAWKNGHKKKCKELAKVVHEGL